MNHKLLIFLFIILVAAVAAPEAEAQCAMCRATVENNVSAGGRSFGAGLNKGILYLMVMPYLTLATIGFFWYRQSKKDRALKEKMMSRLNLS